MSYWRETSHVANDHVLRRVRALPLQNRMNAFIKRRKDEGLKKKDFIGFI